MGIKATGRRLLIVGSNFFNGDASMKSRSPKWLSLSLLALAVPASADPAFSDLFTQGKPILDARYRFENVDQENALRDANAQTLRTRAGFQSGKWYGLSGLIEVDNVSRLGDAAYNDTRNGQREYAVVADPDGTEINQALLRYDHQYGNAVFGRQRINLDLSLIHI